MFLSMFPHFLPFFACLTQPIYKVSMQLYYLCVEQLQTVHTHPGHILTRSKVPDAMGWLLLPGSCVFLLKNLKLHYFTDIYWF